MAMCIIKNPEIIVVESHGHRTLNCVVCVTLLQPMHTCYHLSKIRARENAPKQTIFEHLLACIADYDYQKGVA